MDMDLEMLLSLWHMHLLNEKFLRDHEKRRGERENMIRMMKRAAPPRYLQDWKEVFGNNRATGEGAVDYHAAIAASALNHEVEDVLEMDGDDNSVSNDQGIGDENATETSLPENNQRTKRRSNDSRSQRTQQETSPSINSIPEYVADKEQFYSAIQSFNANQRDVMNARILKELKEDLHALGLADINIKYKLKLVHDLQRNPSDLDEWQLMGNEDRINRVKMYTESDIH